MFRADFQEGFVVFLPVEGLHGVRATQEKRVLLAQIVPMLLELQSRPGRSFSPQESAHFLECENAMIVTFGGRPGCLDDTAYNFSETRRVWPAFQHELRQSRPGIQWNVPPRFDGSLCLQPASPQSAGEPVQVRPSGNHDGGITSPECGADRAAQRVEEGRVLNVELHLVVRMVTVVARLDASLA